VSFLREFLRFASAADIESKRGEDSVVFRHDS
jgi:hypothetical protein